MPKPASNNNRKQPNSNQNSVNPSNTQNDDGIVETEKSYFEKIDESQEQPHQESDQTIEEQPSMEIVFTKLADEGEWSSQELAKLAMDWARILQGKDAQDINKELEELGAKIPGLVVLPETFDEDSNLTVLSHAIYQALREALAHNNFQRTEGTPWPRAILKKGGASGHAELRPPAVENAPLMPPEKVEAWAQLMWQQQRDLSDLDADALDLLSHIWLQQARTPKDYAIAHVDQFLSMRGLEQKYKEQGRRAGYEPEQRAKMLQVLSHIQNVWLNLGEVEIYEEGTTGKGRRKAVKQALQSRAFIITDRMGQMRLDGYLDVERFIFQPGRLFAQFLFGPGRQTALLSVKAVQYDPYRQKWEKRLARYFSWQWRIQARHGVYTRPYRVATLLEAVGEEVNPQRPSRTRERLEKALDTLQMDSVISAWQYDRWDEKVAEQRGWGQLWLQATLLIEPPEVIRNNYKTLERQTAKDNVKEITTANNSAVNSKEDLKKRNQAEAGATKSDTANLTASNTTHADGSLAKRLRQHRKVLRLSQIEAADQLGIVQSYLSKLERNQVKPAPDLYQRIEEWLLNDSQL